MSLDDMHGAEWTVLEVVSITDGDTLRVRRQRSIELDGRCYLLADEDPRGVPIRLAWVDTPERKTPEAWRAGRADLARWVDEHLERDQHGTNLRVVCYESAGWDRLLGDLIAADGSSASQWLMTEGNGGAGWPAYGVEP